MKSNKKSLWFILTIVMMPLSIALVLFSNNYKGHTTQKGVFVQPIVSTKDLNLTPHFWHILYINSSKCNNKCTVVAKQLQQLINIHQTELHRLMVTVITEHADIWRKLLPRHSFSIIKHPPQELLNKLHETSDITAIVDPRGFIPLKYKGKNWPINLNKDLKKLMKQSQIG